MSRKAGYTIPDLIGLAALTMDAANDTDCYFRVVADDGSGKPAFYLWRKATNTWMLLPISDNAIGDRTISSNISSLSDTGKLTILLSSLATQIQAITGKSDWKTAPSNSLETISNSYDKSNKTTFYSRWSDCEKNLYQAGEWLMGQGAYYTQSAVQNHPGIISINATNLNSWSSLNTEFAYTSLDSYSTTFIFKSPPSPPDGTDNYEFNIGFCENPAYTWLGTDAIVLKGSIGASNGTLKWTLVTRIDSTNVVTAINSNCTANTWYTVNLNVTPSLITIIINGAITTVSGLSLPTKALKLFINIMKTLGSTVTETLLVDAIGITGTITR